jgi:steroid 5-alpha reductase family enzyme
MIESIAIRILEAWLLCAVAQTVLWSIAQRTKNAAIVDVGWAQTFTGVVLVFAIQSQAPKSGWLMIAIIVIAWSTRLTCYLVSRGAATGREEGRYTELRKRWGLRASRALFGFFQLQAALTATLSTAFVVPFIIAPWDGGLMRMLGAAVATSGVVGESVADYQLARWKADPSNVGRVCETGLWAYSRHPNYFFEWCMWLGLAIYNLAFPMPWGLLGLLGQGIILASILGVTGIPPTEEQSLRSKGEAYRDYQARVARFIPRPPKHP